MSLGPLQGAPRPPEETHSDPAKQKQGGRAHFGGDLEIVIVGLIEVFPLSHNPRMGRLESELVVKKDIAECPRTVPQERPVVNHVGGYPPGEIPAVEGLVPVPCSGSRHSREQEPPGLGILRQLPECCRRAE